VSHRRRLPDLWLRGAVWQFRTRVPADLESVLGWSHINRFLKTTSYPDAIWATRQIAFEIEGMFNAARRSVGADAVLPRATGPARHLHSPP
jgi:hypothetical protein